MSAERESGERDTAKQCDASSSIAATVRMLECYASGFERSDADALDPTQGRARIRVSIAAEAPHEQSGQRGLLRTSIGKDSIHVAPAAAGDDAAAAVVNRYQACVAHALAHLRYSRPASPVGSHGALRIAVASLIEDARVERLLMREYPGLRELWGRFHTASGEHGLLSFASLAARLARALHDPRYDDPNDWVRKGRELVDAIGARPDDIAAYQDVADILSVDLAQMRVRFDPSSYCVEPLYRDDNTYLWATESEPVQARMERAPDALDQATARSNVADDSRSQDDPPHDADVLRAYRYPEWHARVGLLLQDWTCVYDRERVAEPTFDGDRVELRQPPSGRALPHGWRQPAARLRRRFEGDELDLDAVIDYGVARRMGEASDGRIFEERRRPPPSVSVLLLLDFSASTNDRLDADDTATVLEIEKDAAATVAATFEPTPIRIALHGFASNGRHDVRYLRIKDFDEPFGDLQRRRLLVQQGALSTRMGAALRHAATQFDNERSEAKLLILVTDGEPSDIDVYDSSHLIEDARHAVSMLSARGIMPCCIALDRNAGRYVRAIFGSSRYLALDGAGSLASQIGKVLTTVNVNPSLNAIVKRF
jgi:nitric oxide reductase NorD protein